MATKHAIFLEGLTKTAKAHPETTDALKCIAKCYIINEGLLDPIKAAYRKKPLTESVSVKVKPDTRTPVERKQSFVESISTISKQFPQYKNVVDASIDAYDIVEEAYKR